MTGVLVKGGELDTDTEDTEKRPCGDIVRTPSEDWSGAATSQGRAGATRSWKSRERSFSYRFQREHGSAEILILDF